MKCPNCGHDMVQSRAGMMCLSCGYLVKTPDSGNTTEVPSITIGHDSRGKLGPPADKTEPSPETASESKDSESSEDAKPAVEQVVAEAVKEIGGSTATDAPKDPDQDSTDTGTAKPVIVKVTSADTKPETPEEPAAEEPAAEEPDSEDAQAPSSDDKKTEEDDKPEVKPDETDTKPETPEEPAADEPSADEPAKVNPATPDAPAAPTEALGSVPSSPDPAPASEPETPAAPDETAPEEKSDNVVATPPESLESAEAEEKVEVKAEADAEAAESDSTSPSPEQSAPVGPDAATSPSQLQPEPPVADSSAPQDAPTPAPLAAPAPQPPSDGANPPATPTPDQAPAQAPTTQSAAPDAKAPLQPATHPHPKSNMIAVVAAAAVLIIGAGVTFAVMNHKSGSNSGGTVKAAETGPTQSTPTPTPATDAQTAQPTVDPATGDNQRKADLATYLAAYKAQAVGGYFPVTPPAVSVSATDPGTGQPYTVSKDKPSSAGQIQYWPGGVCTGQPHTPGATGTHYLALVTMLADGVTTYCLDSTHN